MEEDFDEFFGSIEIVSLAKDLKPGDQIASKGEMAALSVLLRDLEFVVGEHYFHHGIYIGDRDCEVIDFGGPDKESAKPRKVSLLQFFANSCDKKMYRVRYKEGVCLPVDETVQMAKEMVERDCWSEYNIVFNNCETFATFLKTKVKASSQALDALRKACSVLTEALASGSQGSGSSSSS